MKFICIMGRTSSGKGAVESTLESMGYKRSVSYTTREPQVRNGKLEESGNEYIFVTEKEFMTLVNKGIIIEYERYNGNLYGTPRPYGAQDYVSVVCIGGFKALKEIYGEQVIGVYLKIDEEVARERGIKRDKSESNVESRKKEDEQLLTEMEKAADIIVDSNQPLNKVVSDILKEISKRNERK